MSLVPGYNRNLPVDDTSVGEVQGRLTGSPGPAYREAGLTRALGVKGETFTGSCKVVCMRYSELFSSQGD